MPDIKIIIIGGLILAFVISIWAILHFFFSPEIKEPSGKARITGSCGDTMEIYLKFKNGRVVETSCWTDGCMYSFNAIMAAAELAKGKTTEKASKLSLKDIIEFYKEGEKGLPECKYDCGNIAVAALKDALKKVDKQFY